MQPELVRRPLVGELLLERIRARSHAFFVLALAGLAVLYWETGPKPVGLDHFVPLADAWLNGRLHIEIDAPFLEQVVRPEGGWYVPYPPGPALVALPFVALLGPGFDIGFLGALLGAANAGLLWRLLGRIGVADAVRPWLVGAFALGSVHWWAAGMSTSWLFAQVVAVCCSLAALNLAVDRRSPFWAGLLLGLGAASRLPIGLTLPLYLALYLGLPFTLRRPSLSRDRLRDAGLVLAGVAIPAALVALYNVARFGSPFDFGYERIVGVMEEPWYQKGILSIEYIPRHLHAMFVRGFDYVDEFPWFRVNWTATSLVITTPLLLWLLRARSREPLVAFAWLAVAIALVPIVTHGNVGFTQFGYRFSLDVAPLIWLLLGWVFRAGMPLEAKVAALIGVAVNAYGIYAVTVLGFASF
jgi:hypothetical protein